MKKRREKRREEKARGAKKRREARRKGARREENARGAKIRLSLKTCPLLHQRGEFHTGDFKCDFVFWMI